MRQTSERRHMEALDYARSHHDEFLVELKQFLRIPSVSTQAEHKPDVERAAVWLRDRLLSAGFSEARVMPTAGHPVVYAERMDAGRDASTVLIYGHYDVQPPDPLDLWDTPPFEPTIVGDEIVARGASDDKGQLYAHVKALEAFDQTTGAPPVNVKCVFEGEEECGSPRLEPFIREHKDLLAADVAVISDTGMLGQEMPSMVYGLRGLAYVEVEVTGPDHDLHSGLYGGAVHNPINALCGMIAKLHDENGRVTIPGFYDNVIELSQEERAELSAVPFDRLEWLEEAGVRTDWGEPTYTITERTSIRPTLDANGIWGGYTEPGAKTVLPSKAFAKISMRLVPNQDPNRIVTLIREHLATIAPRTVDVEVRTLGGGQPALVDRNSPAMKAASRAYALAFGKEPVLVRRGGSIPVVATFQRILGIETVLMGFGLPDDRLHSPNEKFHLPNFYRGIETIIHFMEFLGHQAQ
jgi:acetylornithine deacetylase/succinyl-diaminopimelate desuccinylase-like protein